MMQSFNFGKNWESYLQKHFSEKRLEYAKADLLEILGKEKVEGKTFLDIGCGSGIHSLAAWRLGAKKIVSVDSDRRCVQCCEALKHRYRIRKAWSIFRGSVLGMAFLRKLSRAEVVYAWGSLHHTGDMWQALENAITLVKPGGYLLVALYNRVEGFFGSGFWLKTKKIYNGSPWLVKKVMEFGYGVTFFLVQLFHLKNPLKKIRSYKTLRGMDWFTDIKDWLGGYPYEYASKEEVVKFCSKRGLRLMKCQETVTVGNNVFLWRKPRNVSRKKASD